MFLTRFGKGVPKGTREGVRAGVLRKGFAPGECSSRRSRRSPALVV